MTTKSVGLACFVLCIISFVFCLIFCITLRIANKLLQRSHIKNDGNEYTLYTNYVFSMNVWHSIFYVIWSIYFGLIYFEINNNTNNYQCILLSVLTQISSNATSLWFLLILFCLYKLLSQNEDNQSNGQLLSKSDKFLRYNSYSNDFSHSNVLVKSNIPSMVKILSFNQKIFHHLFLWIVILLLLLVSFMIDYSDDDSINGNKISEALCWIDIYNNQSNNPIFDSSFLLVNSSQFYIYSNISIQSIC